MPVLQTTAPASMNPIELHGRCDPTSDKAHKNVEKVAVTCVSNESEPDHDADLEASPVILSSDEWKADKRVILIMGCLAGVNIMVALDASSMSFPILSYRSLLTQRAVVIPALPVRRRSPLC